MASQYMALALTAVLAGFTFQVMSHTHTVQTQETEQLFQRDQLFIDVARQASKRQTCTLAAATASQRNNVRKQAELSEHFRYTDKRGSYTVPSGLIGPFKQA